MIAYSLNHLSFTKREDNSSAGASTRHDPSSANYYRVLYNRTRVRVLCVSQVDLTLDTCKYTVAKYTRKDLDTCVDIDRCCIKNRQEIKK